MISWMGVQYAWRRMFPELMSEEDVLAIRGGCGNCSCTGICKNEKNQNFKENQTEELTWRD